MDDLLVTWDTAAEDRPIPLLTRRMVVGEQALVAQVRLEKGCHVQRHSHPSEQIACVLSGRVRWIIGFENATREFEVVGGQVLRLPSNLPHEVFALEDTVVLDVLAPPGPMGVDQVQR